MDEFSQDGLMAAARQQHPDSFTTQFSPVVNADPRERAANGIGWTFDGGVQRTVAEATLATRY